MTIQFRSEEDSTAFHNAFEQLKEDSVIQGAILELHEDLLFLVGIDYGNRLGNLKQRNLVVTL